MIRIWLNSPNIEDAGSYLRALGPFSELEKRGFVKVTYNAPTLDWTDLANHDVFFLHRPFTDTHVALAKFITNSGWPLVIDYDDYYLELPNHFPNASVYNNEKAQANIRKCLSLASQVWSATETLAAALRPLSKDVKVVPLAFDSRFQSQRDVTKDKVVLWRGSPSHRRDLELVSSNLSKVIEGNPEWTFWFNGLIETIPRELLEHQNVRYMPLMPLTEYYRWLSELNPRFILVPLEDTTFNRCKAPTAYIEGVWAGAEILSSPLPEWNDLPGVVPSAEDFAAHVNWHLNVSTQRHVTALSHLIRNHRLSTINDYRLMLLESLILT